MIIKNEKPPNWEKINKAFVLREGTIFTYGNIIFNPDGGSIDYPLMAHEIVHSVQQEKIGIETWWNRYLADKDFRASQEVMAYQRQYQEARKSIKDRNRLFMFLRRLAKELSSETYGNIMTEIEAIHAIREERPIEFKV